MKVSVDVHFGYGAVASFALAVGLLTGLYVNEAVSFLFYLGSILAFVVFHFAAMWVHRWHQAEFVQSVVREHEADQHRDSLIEHAMQPIELEPMDVQLSSLRRAG